MSDAEGRVAGLIAATAGVDLVTLFRDGGDAVRAALAPIAVPDVEVNLIGPDGVLQQQFSGVEGFIAAWRDWTAPFSRVSWHPQGEPMARGDRLVNFVEQRGTIAGTTREVTARSAALWHFDAEGMVERIDFHLDRDLALRSLEEAR